MMRWRWIAVLCCLSVISWSRQVFAEQIDQYDVTVTVHRDGSATVTEVIDYDFGNTVRHGIVRSIPIAQSTWYGRRVIALEMQQVLRDGNPEQFVVERNGQYTDFKIGDPNTTIANTHR